MTVEQRARMEAICEKQRAMNATIVEQEQTLEQVIEDARAGLVPIPVPGAVWDGAKNYIVGDTATDGGVLYEATHYSKGKRPSESPGHWKIPEAPTLPDWYSIPDGTIIYEDDEVTCDGVDWRCIMQHMKSTVYKPKAGSSRWVEI